MSEERTLRITTIDELKEYANGCVVELPPFAEGQPFVARLKRPSMLDLAAEGEIPNGLLVKANELFVGTGVSPSKVADKTLMKSVGDVIEVLAKHAFAEPTYQELKDAGVKLTDDQKTFIFNYTQKGVFALSDFRTDKEN